MTRSGKMRRSRLELHPLPTFRNHAIDAKSRCDGRTSNRRLRRALRRARRQAGSFSTRTSTSVTGRPRPGPATYCKRLAARLRSAGLSSAPRGCRGGQRRARPSTGLAVAMLTTTGLPRCRSSPPAGRIADACGPGLWSGLLSWEARLRLCSKTPRPTSIFHRDPGSAR
jgi:hypothetical protein